MRDNDLHAAQVNQPVTAVSGPRDTARGTNAIPPAKNSTTGHTPRGAGAIPLAQDSTTAKARGASPKPAAPAAVARTLAACAYLSVSRSTLHRLVKDGRLKPVQIGARAVGFRYADLDAFLASAAA